MQGTPLSRVLGEYVERSAGRPGGGGVGRDMQFDAVAKQVNRIRTEAVKAQASTRLAKAYAGPDTGGSGGGGGTGSRNASPAKNEGRR
jgi:hypothetical protein